MAWTWNSLLLILFMVAAHQEHVQAYDEQLKNDIVEAVTSYLDAKLTAIDNKINNIADFQHDLTAIKTELRDIKKDLALVLGSVDISGVNGTSNGTMPHHTSYELTTQAGMWDHTIEGSIGCPPGFIAPSESTKCFKLLRGHPGSWEIAKIKCEAKGLTLAEPEDSDVVALRKQIIRTYGDYSECWVAARFEETRFAWQGSGATLSSSSELWTYGHPGRDTYPTRNCVALAADMTGLSTAPDTPYFAYQCYANFYALCEVARG